MRSGLTPDIKTGTIAHVTPSETAAATAIIGTAAQSDHVTRLGLVFPCNVSRMYATAPSKLRSAPPITRYCNICSEILGLEDLFRQNYDLLNIAELLRGRFDLSSEDAHPA